MAWWRTRETVTVLLGFVLVGGSMALLAPRYLNVAALAENWATDLRIAAFTPPADPHPDIVILTITEDTLARLPYRSPLDRGFLVDLLGTLRAAGVRAIGLDVVFDQATEPDKDEALRRALAAMPFPVVVGWTGHRTGLTRQQEAFQKAFLEGLKFGDSNVSRDPADGVVRRIHPGTADDTGAFHPSFPVVIAEALGHAPPRQPVRLLYRGRPDSKAPAFPLYPAHVAAQLPKQWLAGKVVLVGADLPFDDRHRTPFAVAFGGSEGMFSGVRLHAEALAQFMDRRLPPEATLVVEMLIAFGLGIVGALLVVAELPAWAKGAVGLGVLVFFWVAIAWLFSATGWLLPAVSPALGFVLVAGLGSAYAARLHQSRVRFVRTAFSHFVHPAVVAKLEADPESLALGGDKRPVTVLFTDVADFTTMAENLDPTVLVSVLNAYLDGLSNIVLDHNGMIDKFIGDALMAVFGAPDGAPDDAERAVSCALAIGAFGRSFAKEQAERGIPFGRTRIGLHSGLAVVGNIGGQRRFDYTVIGDTVNTASRLEGANRHFGTGICVSAATAAQVKDIAQFRPIGTVTAKGKHDEIELFEVLPVGDADRLAAYGVAFALLKAGSADAAAAFDDYVSRYPGDGLGEFHRRRIGDGMVSHHIVLDEK